MSNVCFNNSLVSLQSCSIILLVLFISRRIFSLIESLFLLGRLDDGVGVDAGVGVNTGVDVDGVMRADDWPNSSDSRAVD